MRIISFGKTVQLLGKKSETRRKWTTKYINEIQAMYYRGDRRLQSYDKFLAAQSITPGTVSAIIGLELRSDLCVAIVGRVNASPTRSEDCGEPQ